MRELDRLSLEAIESVLTDSINTVETIQNMKGKAELCDRLLYSRRAVRDILMIDSRTGNK
jgi:hypothetical protein